jgi:hypothetical protein
LCSLNLAWWFWPGSEILLLKFSLLCRVFNKHNWSASLANVAIGLVLTELGECSGGWALDSRRHTTVLKELFFFPHQGKTQA